MPESLIIESTKNSIINKPIVGNTCTDKSCTAGTVHFPCASDLYLFVTEITLLIATSRAQVNANIV